jgi:hypothetical protein
MVDALLPEGFAALDPFVEAWAIKGANARALARGQAGACEREAFYAAAAPTLPQALADLDAKPFAAWGPRERRLMALMLSLAHVALAVEHQGDAEPGHALLRAHLPVTQAPADD